MNPIRNGLSACVVAAITVYALVPGNSHAQAPAQDPIQFFETKVRPLLAEHCYSCHSVDAKKVQAGLLVDSRSGLIRGGDSGAAIVPGKADDSLLIEAVRYESYEMPPQGKLSDEAIATFEQWVALGAPWPDETPPSSDASRPEFDLQQRAAEHWAWHPIQNPPVPQVNDKSWPQNDLDCFVLEKLEHAGLRPAPDVDKGALLRRLSFDLIGLPPSPGELESFLADSSPQAVERIVDELLDSPHFGERWGRHWLDLVRYAESRGHEFDNDAENAFQYRDYVIRALNADVPYDQFIREHIAGDLLSSPRLNPDQGFNESVLGTGFWFLGEWVHSPVDIRKDESDRFDNMIDVMSKAFLGVTVSCARCHDHKFDAISTADYYSLSGFLQGSDYRQVRFESMEHNRGVAAGLFALDSKYRQAVERLMMQQGLSTDVLEPIDPESAATVLVDYENIAAEEFLQDGYIFGDRPRRAGQPFLSSEADSPTVKFATTTAAVSDPFWDGLQTINERGINNRSKLSELPRSGRTLRTPTFTLSDGRLSCRVQGSGYVVACVDSHRLIAGPLHGETIREIKPNETWVHLNLGRYVGHRLHLEFSPNEESQLEVSLVVQGASDEVRNRLFEREQRIASAIVAAEAAVRERLKDSLAEIANQWAAERSDLQSQITRRSHLAMAMMDGTGEDGQVLIRGNSSKPGDVEPRHFLTAISGNAPMQIRAGSGRLELAEQINDHQNPLTSRVIVNRIWHHLIGRGIVPTTDDFGVLGQRPTHSQLLDHLATRFRSDGQSIKRLIRMIVLSRTYQMSSQTEQTAVAADPKNLLWHHRPPQRLEGESIRDAMLSLSGELDPTMFGEPIPIHLTPFMDGRGRPGINGPLDGAGRRSIYTAVRRNFLSPFMLTFDAPVPFSTMGRRNVSNVPAQALILMNDPLVVELANKWAVRAVESHSSPQARLRWMYAGAFAREPSESEVQVAQAYLDSQAATRGLDPNAAELWGDLAHALINTKEFIFLR